MLSRSLSLLPRLVLHSGYVLLALLGPDASAADRSVLWHIGIPDRLNAEFALAPQGYQRFHDDAYFVIGRSDPKTDWPYVHPGPADGWAGSRRHAFTIAFSLRGNPPPGEGHLIVDFLDTQASSPPKFRAEINGRRFDTDLPAGAGDASVYGDPARGRPHTWNLPVPEGLLRAGENEIVLTAVSGSWALYDAVRLEMPAGTTLAPGPVGTRLTRVTLPSVWLRDGDRAVQPIHVAIRHAGEPAELVLHLDDRPVLTNRLTTSGTVSLTLPAPVSATPRTAVLSVAVDGKSVATTNLTLSPPRLREVWVLPHSHVDVGYTHQQEEIVRIQIANLETALQLAAASAGNPPGERFKWNPEAIWSLDHFLRQATPERREALLAAVRRADIGIDALYGNMLTGLCRPEELARCLSFGPQFAALTGVPVESAAICDVPGWTWGIVPTMAEAGVRYFAIGPNQSARIGSIHRWDNRPFYWKSQSGRDRVLCWVVDNYHHLGDLEQQTQAHADLLAASEFPYDMSFIYWVGTWPDGGVDNAPPDAKLVEKVSAWNARYAAPRVVIGLAREFFHEFERRHGDRVPEFAGDLTPYWEDGAGSTARETALNRASAERLVQAEALFAMLQSKSRPADRIEAAWKNVLLYSEHTWGAHNSISSPDLPFVTNQWARKQAFALDADRESREILALASATTPSAPSPAPASVDVFNTTPWPRTDLALIPEALSGGVDEVRLGADGNPVPSQRLASGELAFLADKVPAFGVKRFHLGQSGRSRQPSVAVDPRRLANAHLRLELDERTGAIRSLRRADSDLEFVDPAAPVGLNDFRYVLGANAAGARTNGPVRFTVVDPGPLVITVRMESDAPGCRGLVRELQLVAGLDRVDLANRVDRLAVREKDSVHFGFGFHVPGGTVRMETPWAIVRPNADQLPGACRNWFTVQRWVDVSNADAGILWAPIDAPLVEIGGLTASLMGEVAPREWLTNAVESTTLYSWAQNNHWFTNYKADQPGVTTFRYRLRPHAGGYSAVAATRFALESTRPLLVVAAKGPNSPECVHLVPSSPDVLLETFKVSEDGQALILRLFGVSGQDRTTRLDGVQPTDSSAFSSTPRRFQLWLTDLTEKPLRRLEPEFTVPAYDIVSVRAEYVK